MDPRTTAKLAVVALLDDAVKNAIRSVLQYVPDDRRDEAVLSVTRADNPTFAGLGSIDLILERLVLEDRRLPRTRP
jgi:hypothetical protein